MMSIKRESYWREYIVLFLLSLLLNALFLYSTFKQGEYCFGTLIEHGEVGYNLACHNSCKINPERVQCIAEKQQELGRYVDYAEIDHTLFGPPALHRDVGDTIGYGFILGLLWKITGSYRYRDIQLLQIFIFSLLMPLVFQCALLLFRSRRCALLCSTMLLLFFPLIFQNVQAHRDIWAYYGVVILLFTLLKFLSDELRPYQVIIGGLIFAGIQFVRPSVFCALLTVAAALLVYGLLRQAEVKKIGLAILIFAATNIVAFWIPFMLYNHHAYGRFFVGPVGQDLLEGIGEYPNPWGYQLDDGWYHRFMKDQYPQLTTRHERDEQAKVLFKQAVRENPWFFVRSYLKRFIAQLLPNLPWSHYPEQLYQGCLSLAAKIKLALTSPRVCRDLLFRMLYIRIFLVMGYMGLALLIVRKQWLPVLVLLGVIGGGFGKFASHLEYRYLVPFYWPFAFFVGYLMYTIVLKEQKQKDNP